MDDGVDSIAMRVRVIAAMEIVSHADLRGAHAVPLPNVLAAVPDCTNARAPTAVENRTGGSLLARRILQTPVKVRRSSRQSPTARRGPRKVQGHVRCECWRETRVPPGQATSVTFIERPIAKNRSK
jgi:hypothetical protein